MPSTRSLGKFTVTRGSNGYTFHFGTVELLTLRPTSTDGPERLALLRALFDAETLSLSRGKRRFSEYTLTARPETRAPRAALDEFNATHKRNPCVETARRWRIPRNVVTWGWRLREAAVLHGIDVSESEMGQADILEEIAW